MKTEEGNKLIAEFMGNEVDEQGIWQTDGDGVKGGFEWKYVKYHSSWDWQIPVWSKVGHLIQKLASKSEDNSVKYLTIISQYESAIFTNDSGKGQKIIVEAIQWYNKTKSQ